MSEVVTLRGHPMPLAQGEPDDLVVQNLERLLDEAKSGKIRAIAWATYTSVDRTTHGWVYGAYGFHLSSAILSLSFAYAKLLDELSEDMLPPCDAS